LSKEKVSVPFSLFGAGKFCPKKEQKTDISREIEREEIVVKVNIKS